MINSIAIFFIIIVNLLLYCFSVIIKPEWNNKINWNGINIFSAISSMVATLPLVFVVKMDNHLVYLISLVSFTIIFYNFFQSLWSDVKLRLVDRKIQYLSIVILLACNLFLLIFYHMREVLNFYIIFILFFSIFMFTPKLMGASDARALIMGVSGLYPIIGIYNFFNVFKALLIILLFYSLMLFAFRSFKIGGLDLSIFKGKINLPAVPLILCSFVITGIFYIV